LRYVDNISITTTAGAVATYVFRANDLFDPDFTSTGHQPMGFDQMMLSYNHFCVLKARIKVTFKNYTSVSQTVAIRQDATSSPLTVINRILEFGGVVSTSLGQAGTFGSEQNLIMDVNIPRLQGVNETTALADPTLRGDAATSPTELTYFHLQAWDAAGNGANIQCQVMLEQLAMFTEPRDLIESLSDRLLHANVNNLPPPGIEEGEQSTFSQDSPVVVEEQFDRRLSVDHKNHMDENPRIRPARYTGSSGPRGVSILLPAPRGQVSNMR